MVFNHNTMHGVAFDVGQTLSNAQRNRIRNTARSSGAWSYVEPASLTPTWVSVLLENDKIAYVFCTYAIKKFS